MKNNNFSLMFITNNKDLSKHASESGVNRIFIDLEINGKYERQGHLDTLISKHSIDDIKSVRKAITKSELLVRINPIFSGTEKEINDAIYFGADIIMLPMYKTTEEIEFCSNIINNRAKFIPLLETKAASQCLEEVVKIPGVSEIYIGLNDLHRDLGLNFMFEPLTNGVIDNLVSIIKAAGLPFGFGGIARIGEGMLPAELILAEHVRLGSSSVILSRTFHRRSESLSELEALMSLDEEVNKIFIKRNELATRNSEQIQEDMYKIKKIVNSIIDRKINEKIV
ncbi:CoA ester lyase [Xenorhabdus bovienii]|uniref:aldolase/citrate lyase family protein n=1 Tax=Xenorhabdus bovienii TaxID=40576 RepID=UPI0023B22385|nr:aldolase/citrate lyase family protein [Xenorhabdus bovienii]MDE9493187.1 CoA ester lyase [Xenorhabdus bovienii]MDE9501723.1 CoA ester lyase [Xenorhabdus bovienii]MDE9525507.1 CoA ester lyase [Xenorhabdus bovienii]MDE9568056.1 CoA ester lyase [Xenorhabdus bovienii]